MNHIVINKLIDLNDKKKSRLTSNFLNIHKFMSISVGLRFMKKHILLLGCFILIAILLFAGCTEQTAIKQKTKLSDNLLPRIQECRTEYFDSSSTATVFFIGVATDDDGTIVLYSWNLSDGFKTNEQSFVHTFSYTGAYQATLTVMDDKGAINTTTITVYVYDSADGDEQKDQMRIVGRWQNTEGTVIEFTSDGRYASQQYQVTDSYWLSNDRLYIRSTTTNNTYQYEYSFTGDNSLTIFPTGHPPTSRDTWVKVS
jgi:hypothetical protein